MNVFQFHSLKNSCLNCIIYKIKPAKVQIFATCESSESGHNY